MSERLPLLLARFEDCGEEEYDAVAEAVASEVLRAAGADLICSSTALHVLARHAAQSRCMEALRASLLQAGVCVDTRNGEGWTPLMYAVRNASGWSSLEAVELLLESRADVNLFKYDGWSPLHMAARYCCAESSIETVKLLLEAKADVTQLLEDGWSALHHAVRYCGESSSVEAVRLLIDAKADVNRREIDNGGWAPLHMAASFCAEQSDIGALKLLLNSGAVDLEALLGKDTPLLSAIDQVPYEGSSVEAVRLLLEAGADATVPVWPQDSDATQLMKKMVREAEPAATRLRRFASIALCAQQRFS